MENNELALVLKNDWVTSLPGNIYNGKYRVGRFHLTDAFIVEYMKLIHAVEIPDSWVSNSFTNISNTDTRKVMYMDNCDILSKGIMNEIRNAVKCPFEGVKIYRIGENIVKIEIMERQNGTNL